MKIIFSLILSLFTAAFAFSSSTNNESKIKSCLAGVYASQMMYAEKAKVYSNDEKNLALNNLPDCDDVSVKIISANKKSFLVEAKYQDQIWTVDSSKTMIKMTEDPSGTIFPDGSVAGEKEALFHFQTYEPALFKKLKEMKPVDMRKSHAANFAWFQRVGNFRKKQKCDSLKNLQTFFKLPLTKEEKCVSDIMKSEIK